MGILFLEPRTNKSISLQAHEKRKKLKQKEMK